MDHQTNLLDQPEFRPGQPPVSNGYDQARTNSTAPGSVSSAAANNVAPVPTVSERVSMGELALRDLMQIGDTIERLRVEALEKAQ
ncbi:hypothetical protein HY441_00365 [Candidatus Microgenomates bacterium]|nr:hypothetical protein [Candidatus Microgenomates bacterium]